MVIWTPFRLLDRSARLVLIYSIWLEWSKVKVTSVLLDSALKFACAASLLVERLSAIFLVAAQSDVQQALISWFAPLDGRPKNDLDYCIVCFIYTVYLIYTHTHGYSYVKPITV